MKTTTKIMKLGINGEGIAYPKKRITFIPQALAKEVVEYEVIKKEKGFDYAKLISVITPSKDRIEPICPISNRCGGCQLMHLKYKKQLKYKQKMVVDSLKKYAKIETFVNETIPAKPNLNYRYHVKLPLKVINDKVVVGMYEPNSNTFVPLSDCNIQTEQVNEMISICQEILTDYKEDVINKHLKGIAIRCIQNQAQVCLVTDDFQLNPVLIERLLEQEKITSLYQNIHPKQKINTFLSKTYRFLGKNETININFENHLYTLTPSSFFQLNLKQASNIHRFVKNHLTNHYDVLLDIFAGVGAFGFSLHEKADKTIALEINKDAVMLANQSAKENKVKNYEAKCMDANIALTTFNTKKQTTLAIIDPPRTGIPHNLLTSLIKNPVTTLVYVSCNPSTFAKNMAELEQVYQIIELQPFDMFCQTCQVEIVAILERKNA